MQSFDENFCDRRIIKTDRIDTELVKHAEIFSDKWVQLFKNPTHNDDDNNLTRIIKTTAIGGHHINRFNVQNSIVPQHVNSHPDSIIEQNKLILLDKKYFKFESIANDDVEIDAIDSNGKDDIEKYATVFDNSSDQIENDMDSNARPIDQIIEIVKPQLANNKIQEKPQTKTSKKKKGRTKYRPMAYDETTTSTANARGTVLAAPPGVKALQSPLTNPHRMDLSKNGNYSLQFRL